MLAKTITYTDFNGNGVTETFNFNLTKAELLELDIESKEGLRGAFDRLVSTDDNKGIVAMFKDILLRAYGVKSEDGRRFIKSKELSENFAQTEAYSELFIDLVTDSDKAVAFLTGVLPAMSPEQQQLAKDEADKRLKELTEAKAEGNAV